ncbi:MAG TPA: diacylglycerol kinase family protein [Longimicrobiales bacterium]|nr:diacylglycerol kinase family protein [Longimicrobiales bacterium]
MTNELHIFMNPHAGRGAQAEGDALVRAFEAVGVRPVIEPVPGKELEHHIQEALKQGSTIIGAAGGDGTISAAANALAGTGATLLPIPMGTLNHFSKRYGITNIDDAVKAFQAQQKLAIAVGSMNDRVFVNNASCGFYPHVVRHRDNMERVLPRIPAMWLAGFKVLFEFPTMRLDVEFKNRKEHIHTPALWVGIGRNSLRIPEVGDADVEGRVLEVVSGRASSRRAVIHLSVRLLHHLRKGLQPQSPNLDVWRAREFVLDSDHKIDIALDGEAYRLKGPLTFRFLEAHLNVLSLVTPS